MAQMAKSPKELEEDFLSSLEAESGTANRAKFIVITGDAGVGKTGACLYAPNPFFITWERGSDWHWGAMFKETVNEKKVGLKPKTDNEARLMIKKIANKSYRESLSYPVETVVIDGATAYQRLVYDDIIRRNPVYGKDNKPTQGIEDLENKGMVAVKSYWVRLLTQIDYLLCNGINVILITHNREKTAVSSSQQQMKELIIDLPIYGETNIPNMVKNEADCVLHMYASANSVSVGKGTWSKNVGSLSTCQVFVQTRATGFRFAKPPRVKDDSKIPDVYPPITQENRAEAFTQIFNDILERN